MIRILTTLALALPLATAQSPLETTFANPAPGFVVTNTAPNTITALYDLTITTDLLITQIDLQTNTTLGTNGQLDVYLTAAGGTHVGNQQNAAAWTLAGQATQVHNGGRVSFVLDSPIAMSPGTYGLAYHCIEINPVYHGGAVSGGLPQQYSNSEMTIDLSAGRNRISDIADAFGGTSNGFSPRQIATALHYEVGSLAVNFTATGTSGVSPLLVQFASVAATTDPGGIQSYSWDFDGDNVEDSTLANPSFTYTTCGSYTVSLTVADANGSLTETKTDFVVTDLVAPAFSSELIAPNTLQFTDLSTPAPTSYEWDLDGDGLTDSTAQNPTFVYATACEAVEVTLTTTRLCQTTSVTREIAVATTLESTFQGGLLTSATDTSAANYFDVDVTNALGVSLCGMHVNSSVAAGQPLTVNIYQTIGTYVGNTDDASVWRLVASETVTAATGPTFVSFSSPVHLAFGVNGICMEHVGASPVYSNVGGAPFVASDANITMTLGLAQRPPIFDAASATFSPRIANVRLHYSTSQVAQTPGYGLVGLGCAGTLGVPGNTASSQPVVGGTCNVELTGLPLDFAVVAVGFARTTAMDLTSIGIDGCSLFHTADIIESLTGAANAATYGLDVPNAASLVGVQLYTQAASGDLGLNPLGFAMSDAAELVVGQ